MFGLSDIALKLIIAGVGALAFTGLIGGGIHHIRTQAIEQAVLEENARKLEQAKKDAEATAKRKEAEAKEAQEREAAAVKRAAAKDKEIARYKNEMRTLQARDPVVREWAAVPVPPTVVACVLGLADCAAGSDQSHGTTPAAEPAASADAGAVLGIEPDERGPGGVWSGLRFSGQGVQRGQGRHVELDAKAAADRAKRTRNATQGATVAR